MIEIGKQQERIVSIRTSIQSKRSREKWNVRVSRKLEIMPLDSFIYNLVN